MKKMILVIVVVAMAFFTAPGMAGEVTIYGWGDLSVDSVDNGVTRERDMVNNASNLGFRFEEQLSDRIKGFLQLEALFALDGEGYDNNDGSTSDPPFLASRNSGLGAISPFGTLIFGGSWNEPIKTSSGGLDPFVTRNGHWGPVINRGYRAKNQILYKSPNFKGLQLKLAKAFDEGDNESGSAAPGDLFSSDVYGGNLTYRNRKSPIGDVFIGVGYRNEEDFRGFDYDNKALRVSAGYGLRYNKNWFTRLGLIYSKDELTDDRLDVKALMGTLSHKMGKVQLNFSYGQADDDISDLKQKQAAGGIDYNISKRFKIYLIYAVAKINEPSRAFYPSYGGSGRNEIDFLGPSPDKDEISSISFGIRYFFKGKKAYQISEN